MSELPIDNRQSQTRNWNSSIASELYQLPAWLRIVKGSYGHQTYYLAAKKDGVQAGVVEISKFKGRSNGSVSEAAPKNIAGALPLAHLKSLLFGNDLISVPFFDFGGITADSADVEKSLLSEAVELARRLRVKSIQLRQAAPLLLEAELCAGDPGAFASSPLRIPGCTVSKRLDKARMVLDLPESSDTLMAGFKSKLRSQIGKPVREGLVARIGGLELLDRFYHVFSINMRDLGSPVHSRSFFERVLEEFPDESRVCMVFKEDLPLAAGIIIGFNGTVYHPWASSLRKYSRLSPNMLLYWTMLKYGCDNGYNYFDFGRSSIGESTYKFKEQWGAKPRQLHWYYIYPDAPASPHSGKAIAPEQSMVHSEKSKFDMAVRIWQKIPVRLTQILGPHIRKHIGL